MRASRAWDKAPYSLNMVKLFSFGCHVIDQAYARINRGQTQEHVQRTRTRSRPGKFPARNFN